MLVFSLSPLAVLGNGRGDLQKSASGLVIHLSPRQVRGAIPELTEGLTQELLVALFEQAPCRL